MGRQKHAQRTDWWKGGVTTIANRQNSTSACGVHSTNAVATGRQPYQAKHLRVVRLCGVWVRRRLHNAIFHLDDFLGQRVSRALAIAVHKLLQVRAEVLKHLRYADARSNCGHDVPVVLLRRRRQESQMTLVQPPAALTRYRQGLLFSSVCSTAMSLSGRLHTNVHEFAT
jgi:hypothetical protein